MEQTVDLHLHSSVSMDGELPPEELMRRCAAAGLVTVALTDHNSVRGVAQARLAARVHGIRLISGIELDCVWEGRALRLLGYGVDETRVVFADVEENILRQERHASGLRIELIRKCGIQIDGAWLCSHARDGVITGKLIAEAAMNDAENINSSRLQPYRPGGPRSDDPYLNFCLDYCTPGGPAYVPIRYMQAAEAIQMIHACGGVAVLAHPGAGNALRADELQRLADIGMDGVEAYSNYHTPEQTAFYCGQAGIRGLLVTCGSDFHGKRKPYISLGGIHCDDSAAYVDALLARIQRTASMLLPVKGKAI